MTTIGINIYIYTCHINNKHIKIGRLGEMRICSDIKCLSCGHTVQDYYGYFEDNVACDENKVPIACAVCDNTTLEKVIGVCFCGKKMKGYHHKGNPPWKGGR